MKHLAAVVTIVLALSATALPASAQTVSGAWKCVAKSEGRPNSEFRLDLVQKGREVTGTASRSDGSADVRNGSFENGKLKLAVDADNGVYELEATLSGNKLTGTLSHSNGGKASWEGVREGAAAAASAPSGIEGTWKMAQYVLEFKKEGETLTGQITLPDGQTVRMSKASFAENTVKFTVPSDEGTYEAEGKLEGNKLSGTYTTPSGTKRDWEATRS